MKRLLLFVVFIVFAAAAQAQQSVNYASEARLLKKAIVEQHIQPIPVDDAFSKLVYDQLLNELDPDRMYFHEGDLMALKNFRDKLDDELNGKSWTFLPQLATLYKNCLLRYRSGITALAAQPTDFIRGDSYPDDSVWTADINALKNLWSAEFRYRVFDRLYDSKTRTNPKNEKEFLSTNEKAAREQVQKILLREADRIINNSQGFEGYVAAKFFDAIGEAFDPHTSYLSPQALKEFVSSLSSKGYYYGFTADENEKGDVAVAQILPGGPVWKSGEINAGDVIQEIKFEGQPSLDLGGLDKSEVNDILEESTDRPVAMTFKKPDGSMKSVTLKKEQVDNEDDVVKSFVLTGSKKIGYISLPDFYSDWGDEDGGHCANDVAREIVKLKKENIEGLILDVRYNGGGDMEEAVALAGIFIDAGPILALKEKKGEVIAIKDMNRGTIYDGPLIVMVNEMSASASEMLAAALQDYHRAVIVGGTTYGKGTAQQLVPVNPQALAKSKRSLSNVTDFDIPLVKITIERFYRVNGKTTQYTGVVPDILLPDVLQSFSIGERYRPTAPRPDSTTKKIYYRPLPEVSLDKLKINSQERVKQQKQFAQMLAYGEWVVNATETYANDKLNWVEFVKLNKEMEAHVAGLKVASDETPAVFQASKLTADTQRMQLDSYADDFNRRWIKNLASDIYLEEAFQIMCDIISDPK